MKKRVVITGMGVISPVGSGLDRFWQSLQDGKSGIGPITLFDTTDFAVQIAGEVKDVNPEDHIDLKEVRKIDRFAQWGIIASDEAIAHSEITSSNFDPARVGVIVASGIGGIGTFGEQQDLLREKGPRRVSPFFIPKMIPDITSGHISIKYGFKGVNYTVASACASANHAIGIAYRHIQYGDADVMVCGGSEAAITPLAVAGFSQIKALSKQNDAPETASRPFDAERDGFVIAEGAGILVLEEFEHAHRRGAKIYGEIGGIGMSADAYHLTAPHPDGEGAVASMRMALRDADISMDKVDYLNAHGTSTPMNDKIETYAIKQVFGDSGTNLAISSTKSMTGHLLGAAGGVEAIASAMAMIHSIVPPTINYQTPDPDCDLNYTPNHKISKKINYVMSNTFGFGGHNATLIIKSTHETH